jgi:hypothetical protein
MLGRDLFSDGNPDLQIHGKCLSSIKSQPRSI